MWAMIFRASFLICALLYPNLRCRAWQVRSVQHVPPRASPGRWLLWPGILDACAAPGSTEVAIRL